MKKIIIQINDYLKKAERIVIVPHQHPDGDALGSATALYEYLTFIKKHVEIFCATPISEKIDFLPHIKQITADHRIFKHPQLDTVIVLDSGDLGYAGVREHLRDSQATIINIDHHHTNSKYGHFNLVAGNTSSTSEIIYHFLKTVGMRFTHRMATSLLTGIITDTDNFTNSATCENALLAAGDLVRCGGNLNLINEKTVRNKTMGILQLWGAVLERLEKRVEMNMAYTYITQADLKKHNVSENESEGIANFLNNIDDVKIALILKETVDGKIKGSFRTTGDDIDVAAMAKKMGGGGHKKAAGFTTTGTVEEVLTKILTDH